MKKTCARVLAALSLFGFGAAAAGIQKVTRSGRYLYTADGNRFYVKGIAYQTQVKTAPREVSRGINWYQLV
ncbi:hypothetical protein K438DRAFT_1989040 [Mycena galopus ATCC 62051]|nr:hypothetical protein K438DRAFT_1989040 [Mycena galopus ATCC 62051]